MRRAANLVSLIAGMVLTVATAAAEDERREAGAHVHGSGHLAIAIENNKIALDLDTPANDIIGFEHAPQTTEQKAALEKAIATMKDAAKIFRTTPAAGCQLTKAEAGLEQPDPADAKKAEPSEHADFSGTFEFECNAITKLTSIELGYFAAFPGASKLDISIATAKTQTTREATKASPRIDLKGLN